MDQNTCTQFDNEAGGSTSWRVNPNLVEDIVVLYGDKIDNADPDGERIVRPCAVDTVEDPALR